MDKKLNFQEDLMSVFLQKKMPRGKMAQRIGDNKYDLNDVIQIFKQDNMDLPLAHYDENLARDIDKNFHEKLPEIRHGVFTILNDIAFVKTKNGMDELRTPAGPLINNALLIMKTIMESVPEKIGMPAPMVPAMIEKYDKFIKQNQDSFMEDGENIAKASQAIPQTKYTEVPMVQYAPGESPGEVFGKMTNYGEIKEYLTEVYQSGDSLSMSTTFALIWNLARIEDKNRGTQNNFDFYMKDEKSDKSVVSVAHIFSKEFEEIMHMAEHTVHPDIMKSLVGQHAPANYAMAEIAGVFPETFPAYAWFIENVTVYNQKILFGDVKKQIIAAKFKVKRQTSAMNAIAVREQESRRIGKEKAIARAMERKGKA